MTTRYSCLAKFSPLLLVVYFLFLARNQVYYERLLTSLSITFDDFPSDYAAALVEAQKENKNPDYNWPPVIVPEPSAQTSIPPSIHFIWFPNLYHEHLDISQIPAIGSDAPEICQQHNPSFNIQIWNATAARALLETHYEWFLPIYDSYRYPIQRVDAFKYFVLWHYGGVYMDLDIECRCSLDPLLPFPAWFPKANPLGVNNDLMATRARHPLTHLMLKGLSPRNRSLVFPYLTIFWSTGPQFTSDMLKKWALRLAGSTAYVPGTRKADAHPDAVFVLPRDFYSEKYTFFGHSPGGTWHGEDVAIVLWLVARP